MRRFVFFMLAALSSHAAIIPNNERRQFYDQRLEHHVARIANQIAAFNAHEHQAAPSPDDEQMQSDQPQSDQLAHVRRKLDETAMRNSIRDRVMSFIGGTRGRGVRDRSVHASCDSPATDGATDMRLHFTLPPTDGGVIVMATLRLRRRVNDTSAICTEDQRTYRVTAYNMAVQRTARKQKPVKRRIMDARVMAATASFIDLDVLVGVRDTATTKGQLTIVVEVEDQYGAVVDANAFFAPPPKCGSDATSAMPAIPSIVEEMINDDVVTSTQPKLDIRTSSTDGVDVPCRTRHAHHMATLDPHAIRAFLDANAQK